MYRACGVGERSLSVSTMAPYSTQRCLHIAWIVHRIENAEHIHAVFHRAFNETFHDVVSVVAITQEILSAQQHLQRRFRHRFFQFTQADPWIFTQKANAGVIGCTAPALQ